MASPFRIWRKHQKTLLVVLTLLAMISFVVLPIVMDMMGNSPTRDPVVVSTTAYGNLHERKLQILRHNRGVLGGFMEHVAQAAMEAGGDGRKVIEIARSFGSPDEESVVETWLLANRAEELGIVVSDEAINGFLSSLTTQNKVSREKVEEIMQMRQISADALFAMLRHEMLAMRLREMFAFSLGGITPAQRWDYYQRLNHKAKIEVAPLPVAGFVDKVADPDEAALREFFQAHKTKLFDPDSPQPGFREPKRIALEYFKAGPEAVAISDEEIQKYYDEHKEQEFVQETLPEVKKETPAVPAKPEVTEPKPAAAAPKPTAKDDAVKEPAKEKPPKEKTSSVKVASPFRLAAYQAEEKEKAGEAAKAKPETKPAEPAKEAAKPAAAKAEKPAAKSEADAGHPKYIPLEKVKNRIRATLAERKIREVLSRLQDRMQRYHDAVTLYEVHREDPRKKDQVKPPPKPDFRKLAAENGLGFYKTELISALEAQELDLGQSFLEGNVPFVTYAFETLPLYRPEVSQDVDGNHYLFWKTAQVEERVPEYTDEGVRERVVRAWKMSQARSLARREAQRLAKEVREAGKPLTELLARQPGMIVHTSEPFSWMTYGAFPAWWAQTPPQISQIRSEEKDPKTGEQVEIVFRPGNEFMRTVFQLEQGQVGAAMNQPETVAYVVRATEVTPAVWQAFLVEDYSRYMRVAMYDQRALVNAWYQSLKDQAGFRWERDPEAHRGRGE